MKTIVSLTSYGQRIKKTLPRALESLRKLDGFKPDTVFLYLAEQDVPMLGEDVTRDNPNLTVVTVPDTMPYKKYTALTDRTHDDDIVFIFDDDVILSPDTWVSMKEQYDTRDEHAEQPCIYTKVAAYITESGHYLRPNPKNEYGDFLFWSGRGMLIPPHTLRFDKHILDDGFKTIPTDDDTFMSVCCAANNIKCRCAFGIQHELDFNGNKRLYGTNKGNFKTNRQLALRYFNLPNADRITVSIATDKPVLKQIESLFTRQTLKPDSVIVNVRPDTKIPNAFKSSKYDIDIQRSDNPDAHRWIPDTDLNDLVFVIGGTEHPDDLIERMFAEYYSSQNPTYSHTGNRYVHINGYGHRHVIDTNRTVFRRRHTDGLDTTAEDIATEIIRTVTDNSRR